MSGHKNSHEGLPLLKELHSDLARKYRIHASAIIDIWRSSDASDRAKWLKQGNANGVLPKDSMDQCSGNLGTMVPELNLQDMAESGPEFFLEILKHRATTSLFQQYCSGPDGKQGDYDVIAGLIALGLRAPDPCQNCFTLFMDSPNYGITCTISTDEDRAVIEPGILTKVCVLRWIGDFVMERQHSLLQFLNIVVVDILDLGSKTRSHEPQEKKKKFKDDGPAALSRLTIRSPKTKVTTSDLVNSARDQREMAQEYLDLIYNEPVVLAHALGVYFWSRPGIVADEKGRLLPIHTDKYLSSSFFEVIQTSVQSVALWKYITRLLERLEDAPGDKARRALTVQELANCCHLQYTRAQSLFKRYVQTGTGRKWFQRISNAYDDNGNPRVTMKVKPENLTVADSQLHYMLRLCQPKIQVTDATSWIKKLGELHVSHPEEREKMWDKEVDSLSELAVIVEFIQDLSSAILLPSSSGRHGQAFISKSRQLDIELNHIKNELDLLDFIAPINNLLEPGVAKDALKKFDQFTVETVGTSIASLYQDLVDESLALHQDQCERVQAKLAQNSKFEWPELPKELPQSTEIRVQQRKEREKTRPPHSSFYNAVAPAQSCSPGEPASPEALKTDESTAEALSKLFDKSQARGSLTWMGFEAAMAKLGFSVLPKQGSVYTFYPPEGMSVNKSFTTHRPHNSKIEGYRAHILARRLKSVYGWSEETFRVESATR